jgi:hypothetical protein
VPEDIHPEADRRVGDQAADLAQADHAKRMAGQFDAGVGLLAASTFFPDPESFQIQIADKGPGPEQGSSPRSAGPRQPVPSPHLRWRRAR